MFKIHSVISTCWATKQHNCATCFCWGLLIESQAKHTGKMLAQVKYIFPTIVLLLPFFLVSLIANIMLVIMCVYMVVQQKDSQTNLEVSHDAPPRWVQSTISYSTFLWREVPDTWSHNAVAKINELWYVLWLWYLNYPIYSYLKYYCTIMQSPKLISPQSWLPSTHTSLPSSCWAVKTKMGCCELSIKITK